jgi:hypothetical protein
MTRTKVLDALETAVVVLNAADPVASRRRSLFIDLFGIDPGLVDCGRGRLAAQILSRVMAALRERTGRTAPNEGATDERTDEATTPSNEHPAS